MGYLLIMVMVIIVVGDKLTKPILNLYRNKDLIGFIGLPNQKS